MKNQFFYVLLTTFMLLFMGQGYAENHPPMDNDGMGGCPLAQEQCDCIKAACPHDEGNPPDKECFMTEAPGCGVPADMMEMGPGPDGMPPCPEGDEECMKGMGDGGMPPCPEGDEECMMGMTTGGMPPCPEGDEECMKGMGDGGMPPCPEGDEECMTMDHPPMD